jgi:peptide/nickel transport system permease protein
MIRSASSALRDRGLASLGQALTGLSEDLRTRHRVAWVVARRLVLALPILLLAPFVTFVLARVALTSQNPFSDNLESPPESFGHWLSHALRGDLGTSMATGDSVLHRLGYELPVTVSLIVGALLVSLLVGGALGGVSAVRGGALGRALDALALVGFAFPVYWLGPVLVEWFAVRLHWTPAIFLTPPTSAGGWVRQMVLPIVTLSFGGIAAIATQTREAMLETLGSEYVRMARARGISARSVIFRHALRPASLKVITVLGVLAAGFLTGSVFVENVFLLPGLGTQLLDSAEQHDLPVLAAIAAFFALLIVVVNLTIDLVYAWLNPRVVSE